MIKAITSKNNERVKFAYSLKDNKNRKKYNMFLSETFKCLEMALLHNRVVEVFTLEYLNIDDSIPQNLVSKDVLKKLSSNVHPDGVVFIAKISNYEVSNPKKILYLDDVSDPGNMGTLIRSALAFDYDLIVTSNNSVSIYNEKVISASKGAIFAIPIINASIQNFQKSHHIFVSNLSKNAIDFNSLSIPDKFVLVLGNESHGVSKNILKVANQEIIIPIKNIDSLNVAVAGGILMNKIH